MSSVDELDPLAAAGIALVSGEEGGEVHAEAVRIARRVHAARQKVIGFIPATDKVAVPPVALQIAGALVELTGATIAFVDANVRYPALADIAADQPTAEESRAEHQVFHTRWLRGSLAVLTPSGAELAGQAVPALARLLLDGIELFEYVLVDLTGFDLLGEHASAAACMDAVVVVASAHQTREKHLLRLQDEMPERRFLGVLLVG